MLDAQRDMEAAAAAMMACDHPETERVINQIRRIAEHFPNLRSIKGDKQ